MREQIAQHYSRRASATREELAQRRTNNYPPANSHRAGHYAGLHPEDQPYMTRQQQSEADVEEEDSYYPQRMPSSAKRYTITNGQQVIQQGNRRLVIHNEPPPRPKHKVHWMLILGIGMILMLFLWIGFSWVTNWWTMHQMDATYGFPRTYQVDEVVGHSDSTDHPTHFIFENLSRHIIIIELPGGDVSHARIYSGPTLFSDNGELIPVTAEFKDVNGDGKIDMILHIQDQRIIYLNDGTQFKPQQ